jgi:hypothetical protein
VEEKVLDHVPASETDSVPEWSTILNENRLSRDNAIFKHVRAGHRGHSGALVPHHVAQEHKNDTEVVSILMELMLLHQGFPVVVVEMINQANHANCDLARHGDDGDRGVNAHPRVESGKKLETDNATFQTNVQDQTRK